MRRLDYRSDRLPLRRERSLDREALRPLSADPLEHGDVVVWGGPSRLAYHGIMPVKEGEHPRLGRQRLNLTLRKAL